MTKWQDISTAPRGVFLLLGFSPPRNGDMNTYGHRHVSVGKLSEYGDLNQRQTTSLIIGVGKQVVNIHTSIIPTHWMPLPPSPNQ